MFIFDNYNGVQFIPYINFISSLWSFIDFFCFYTNNFLENLAENSGVLPNCLRWNTENMTSSIMSPQKKLHNYCFYEHFTTGNRLVCALRKWQSQLAAHAHTNIIETVII